MVYRLQSSAIQRSKFLRNESIQKRQRKLKCINHVIAVKSTKGISKSHIANAQSAKCGHKQKDMVKVLDALMEIATEEVKTHGKFTIPGIVMVKKRYKPGRSAGKVMLIGKQYDVKAKAGHNVIKAFVINPLKSNVKQPSSFVASQCNVAFVLFIDNLCGKKDYTAQKTLIGSARKSTAIMITIHNILHSSIIPTIMNASMFFHFE